jgi:tRNA (cmo5U34)-methyltransferase
VLTLPRIATKAKRPCLNFCPKRLAAFSDLGAGGGRLLSLVKSARRTAECVALDFSPTMLQVLRHTFGSEPGIAIVEHDLACPLPALGRFDAVVSSFAIHRLPHDRKRNFYVEVFGLLSPGGVFLNLEHVSSPALPLHHRFLHAIGVTPEDEDPSNKLLDFEVQLAWFRQIGFMEVDCHWKWRELALMAGSKPD